MTVKLVRDRVIPDEKKHQLRTAKTPAEYQTYLIRKLTEEVVEFAQYASGAAMCQEVSDVVRDGMKEEMADVLEVLEACATTFGIDVNEVFRIKREKAEKKGRFDLKLIWNSEATQPSQ
jgi:predicted house-cleaning noncanonical NTP pyrophosphatase (MazG superfamily)